LDALISCESLPPHLSERLAPIQLEALLAKLVLISHSLRDSDDSITLSQTVVAVTNYINQHLTENITLDTLCEQFFVSKVHLNRIFTKSIGTTVFEYIAYKRIGLARNLLENGVPAKEVAIQVGYNDYSSFFRAYKKITGHAPTHEIFSSQV
jgi:YesN/AraC family two-component response regulator